MFLAIRTDSRETEVYILDKDRNVAAKRLWNAGRNLSIDLLKVIQDLNEEVGIKIQDHGELKGIIFFKGPGSFTGLRIGASISNAISYSLDIPIVGTKGDNWIKEGMKRFDKNHNDVFVNPEYGNPPNITRPKK